MLMQNFGATNKEHYGMLWYFLEWSIRLAADKMTSKLVARFRVTGKPGLFYKTSVQVERAEFL